MKKIIHFIFWCFGWRIDKIAPVDVKKCVIVVGPIPQIGILFLGEWLF